ncbi:MAG: glucose-1-phosphate cytidylyltransferase [Planctomycetaceae bacterium]|jgi:glucose-1-phosphate cytidylyltransferase
MNVVILAGGLGTRLGEETEVRPKPMVEVGGRPILWHILKHYSHHGFAKFFIALGYKGEHIKRYFLDFGSLSGSLRINTARNAVLPLDPVSENWDLHLIDTGSQSNTGGRVLRMAPYLKGETFMVTYGDGVSNVDLRALLEFHRRQGKLVTLTAVRPPARFGGLLFDGDMVAEFTEKPQAGEGWINGGFLVCEPGIFDYLQGDATSLEAETLERLARAGQLAAYKHDGFWQCMDTLRDKKILEDLWQKGSAPWKTWE